MTSEQFREHASFRAVQLPKRYDNVEENVTNAKWSHLSDRVFVEISVSLRIYKRAFDLDDIQDVVSCHMQTGSQIAFILTTQGLSCILSFDRLFLVIFPLIYENNKDRLKSLYRKLTIAMIIVNVAAFFASYFDNFNGLEKIVLICFMRNSTGPMRNKFLDGRKSMISLSRMIKTRKFGYSSGIRRENTL
uniref:G-protein coupled receptors family 1 profile domain-containing protein n=1 Tax=Romanomermis culicivorax TaxID=13658 RepID=A0A915LCF7_ROMCU